MPVLSSELKIYRSATVNDTASNGGRLSTVLVASGLYNSLWPDVDPAEATAGNTKYRKCFVKVDNAANLPASNARIGLFGAAPGDIRHFLSAGTQTDVQSGVGATLYGGGKLDADVSLGASSIAVLVERGADVVFRAGDQIVVTDQATVGGSGNVEFHVVSGTPSVAGDVVTIALAGTLAHGFGASNTFVSSLLPLGTIQTAIGSPTVTSAAGTFAQGQATVPNIGALYQTWTFTFSSATAFACVGDTVGAVGSGNINSTFAPNNPTFGSPYLSVPAAAWGGSFLAGDTVTVLTTPAAAPFWERRVVPAGASNLQGHLRKIRVFCNG